jgi:hypothetical protein
MEQDLGTRLEWVAIDHHNTDHPHLHILVRGRDDQGRPLTLDPTYMMRGIRDRSETLVTDTQVRRSTVTKSGAGSHFSSDLASPNPSGGARGSSRRPSSRRSVRRSA